MKILLCVPDSGPLGRDLLEKILSFGFDGVRVDVDTDDHARNWAQIESFVGVPNCFVIFLLAGGTMTRKSGEPWATGDLEQHVRGFCSKLRNRGFRDGNGFALEIGNEPDLAHERWKGDPEGASHLFFDCYHAAREYFPTTPILCPSVSNLNKRGLSYLRKMSRAVLPTGCGIAFHRYPHNGDRRKPHKGFDERGCEVVELGKAAGSRDLWLTETGISERPAKGKPLTEEQVACQFLEEVRFWSQFRRVEALCWYQLNDGLDPNDHLHHYGIRRHDGAWKPITELVASARRLAA